MRRAVALGLLTLSFAATPAVFVYAEDTVEAAQQKLKEKAAARAAERAKKVTITAGELEDLRTRLRLLEAENAAMKTQLAGGNKKAVAGHRSSDGLEVGMTREEVLAFVKARRSHYQLVSDTLGDVIVGTTTEKRTAVQGDDRLQTVRGGTQLGDGASTSVQNNGQVRKTETETEIHKALSGGKTESIVIAVMGSRQVAVGSHKDALGGVHADTAMELQRVGTIRVELVENVVTSISGQ